MNVAESIYQGYVTTRGAYENPQEIQKAVLELSGVIQNMFGTKKPEIQEQVFSAAVELAEETEKQGFVAGFQYAAEMFGVLSRKESA